MYGSPPGLACKNENSFIDHRGKFMNMCCMLSLKLLITLIVMTVLELSARQQTHKNDDTDL